METWALMVWISRLGLEMEEILMKLDGIGDGQGRRPVKKVERRSRLWRFVDKPMFFESAMKREKEECGLGMNIAANSWRENLALLKKKKQQR